LYFNLIAFEVTDQYLDQSIIIYLKLIQVYQF